MYFPKKIHELLKEFPELTKEKSPSEVVKHSFIHRIITEGQPVSQQPRRLNPLVHDAAETVIQQMFEDGTI